MDVELNELVEPELPVEDERPAWLPPNFKSPEDFRKSYDEAQATLTREQQRRAEAENTLSEILAAQEEEQPPSSPLEGAWREDPYGLIAAAAAEAATAAVEAWERAVHQAHGTPADGDKSFAGQVDAALTARYPDWHDVRPKLAGLIEADPRLLPEEALNSPGQTIDALERLYAAVKLPEIVRGQQEASRLAKVRAQTQGGTLGRPDPRSADLAEQVRQSIRDAGGPYRY